MREPPTIPPMTPAGILVLEDPEEPVGDIVEEDEVEDEVLLLEGEEVLLRDEEVVADEPVDSGPIQSCSRKILKNDMV